MFRLIKTKGCQRCGGDLFLEQDEYGVYISCIQCGGVHAEYSERDLSDSNLKLLVKVGGENKAL
jgi:hypothetical protein